MIDDVKGRVPGPFPEPPAIAAEVLSRCRETGDYRQILFEWYKFVAEVSSRIACLRGPALLGIPRSTSPCSLGS